VRSLGITVANPTGVPSEKATVPDAVTDGVGVGVGVTTGVGVEDAVGVLTGVGDTVGVAEALGVALTTGVGATTGTRACVKLPADVGTRTEVNDERNTDGVALSMMSDAITAVVSTGRMSMTLPEASETPSAVHEPMKTGAPANTGIEPSGLP
jgi:hypothetical protein